MLIDEIEDVEWQQWGTFKSSVVLYIWVRKYRIWNGIDGNSEKDENQQLSNKKLVGASQLIDDVQHLHSPSPICTVERLV